MLRNAMFEQNFEGQEVRICQKEFDIFFQVMGTT